MKSLCIGKLKEEQRLFEREDNLCKTILSFLFWVIFFPNKLPFKHMTVEPIGTCLEQQYNDELK